MRPLTLILAVRPAPGALEARLTLRRVRQDACERLASCAGSGLSAGRRTLSTNFLATHQRDADCWTALLCRAGWGKGPWRCVSIKRAFTGDRNHITMQAKVRDELLWRETMGVCGDVRNGGMKR